jgi:hypothetical protein
MSIARKARSGRPGVRILIGAGDFTVLQYGRTGFGGPHSGYRAAFLEGKGLAREATHLSPSSAVLENEGSCTSICF